MNSRKAQPRLKARKKAAIKKSVKESNVKRLVSKNVTSYRSLENETIATLVAITSLALGEILAPVLLVPDLDSSRVDLVADVSLVA